jgi:hypothetical protein
MWAVRFAWVTLEEAKGYKLLDGIYDESVMVDKAAKNAEGQKKADWQKA